jgi:hypothetical protein
MRANLLQFRGWRTCLLASGGHALYSATPLFDETEFVEHVADHPVPKFGHTLRMSSIVRPNGRAPGFSTSMRLSNMAT